MTVASNAPIGGKAELIVETVLSLLRTYPHLSKVQQTCYEIIEVIFCCAITSDIAFAQTIFSNLLPLMQKTWQRTSQAQREPMLAIMLQGYVILPNLLDSSQHEELIACLDAFLETIQNQYCARKTREQLQLEDIELCGIEKIATENAPLSLQAASIRLGAFKAEEPWCIVLVSAVLLTALETCAKRKMKDGKESHSHAKRRKVLRPVQSLISLLRDANQQVKVFALQVTAFIFNIDQLDHSFLLEILEFLMSQTSSDDVVLTSWTIFAIMR